MLTVDILRQNKALSELTDEQLNAIATLSQNDETQVIQTKVKEERTKATLSLSQAFGIDDVTDLTFEKAVEFGKNKLSSVDSAKFEKTIADPLSWVCWRRRCWYRKCHPTSQPS